MSLWRRISASTNLSPEGEQYIAVAAFQTAVGHDPILNLTAFPFDAVNGFGTRLEPSTEISITQGGGAIEFSPSGAALATVYVDGGNGRYNVLDWDAGFGSKYASQPSSPAAPDNVQFHPDGDYILYSEVGGTLHGTKIYAYNWSDASGIGSQFGGTVSFNNPTQDFVPMAISPDGDFVAVGYSSSFNLGVIPFSTSTGLGTKVEPTTDPISGEDLHAWDVAWNNAGTYVALGCNSYDPATRLHIWEWNKASGTFGSKVTGISINPTNTGQDYVRSIAFSPDDAAILIGTATDKLAAYEWDNSTGTFGSKINSATGASGAAGTTDIRFNTNGNVVFATGGRTSDVPVMAWEWNSSTGFGSKYDNPDTSGYGSNSSYYSLAYIDLG